MYMSILIVYTIVTAKKTLMSVLVLHVYYASALQAGDIYVSVLSIRLSVCPSVCPSATFFSPAITKEPFDGST